MANTPSIPPDHQTGAVLPGNRGHLTLSRVRTLTTGIIVRRFQQYVLVDASCSGPWGSKYSSSTTIHPETLADVGATKHHPSTWGENSSTRPVPPRPVSAIGLAQSPGPQILALHPSPPRSPPRIPGLQRSRDSMSRAQPRAPSHHSPGVIIPQASVLGTPSHDYKGKSLAVSNEFVRPSTLGHEHISFNLTHRAQWQPITDTTFLSSSS